MFVGESESTAVAEWLTFKDLGVKCLFYLEESICN